MHTNHLRSAARRVWRRPGLAGDLQSVVHAARGLGRAVREERPVQIQLAVAAAAVAAGARRRLSPAEWAAVALAVSGVIASEVRNASLERLCDHIEPDYHREIGLIKDSSAGSVLVSGLGAVTVGAILLGRRRR